MDKTMTLILMYSIIAVMILNITYVTRLVSEPFCLDGREGRDGRSGRHATGLSE
jgi:hypothetical protein